MREPLALLTGTVTSAPSSHGSQPHVGVSRLEWEPVDLSPVLSGERVTGAPSVLARGDGVKLLYPARLNLLLGEPETGKSWVALLAAVQEMGAGHHVLYLDYEDVVETAVERLLALGAKAEDLLAHFSYYESPPKFDEIAQDLICTTCHERGVPTLVVLDGVTEAMGSLGLDPNSGLDVTMFYSGSPRGLARTGAAVVLLDHVTKDREGRGRWAIGSERKLSGLDGAAYAFDLLRPFGRERTGLAKLMVSKDRCGYVRQQEGARRAVAMFELKAWPDGTVSARLEAPEPSTDPDKPFQPTKLMERVSRTLEGAPGPLSTKAVRAQTTGKASMVDVALELLIAEGFVATEPGARGAVLHRSLRPFRVTAQEVDE
jgi:hypothetical protein